MKASANGIKRSSRLESNLNEKFYILIPSAKLKLCSSADETIFYSFDALQAAESDEDKS